MDNCFFDETKLASRCVIEGISRVPHRSYVNAMGLTREEIHQLLVGVAFCEVMADSVGCDKSLHCLDHGVLQGDGLIVTGRTVNENLKNVGHVGSKAMVQVRDGDLTKINAFIERIELHVGDAELEKKKKRLAAASNQFPFWRVIQNAQLWEQPSTGR
ncbi:MAG TPA: hypothetical protein VME69_12290 [Methylocella sp.]|nr:hypothetical protein [Methylocella sp.]